jgi:hypothetical protein
VPALVRSAPEMVWILADKVQRLRQMHGLYLVNRTVSLQLADNVSMIHRNTFNGNSLRFCIGETAFLTVIAARDYNMDCVLCGGRERFFYIETGVSQTATVG